jgi:hypothetical protein
MSCFRVAFKLLIGCTQQVVAYWFTSARMAATAASFTPAGARKSGKPYASNCG